MRYSATDNFISNIICIFMYYVYFILTKALTSILYFNCQKHAQIQCTYMFLHAVCVKTKCVIAKFKTVSIHKTSCLTLTWVTAYGGRGRRQLQTTAYSLRSCSKCTYQVTDPLTDKQLTIRVKTERTPDYHFHQPKKPPSN
jgi:hypothetical protein